MKASEQLSDEELRECINAQCGDFPITDSTVRLWRGYISGNGWTGNPIAGATAAAILARRAAPVTPARERLGPWEASMAGSGTMVRCAPGAKHDGLNHGVIATDRRCLVYAATGSGVAVARREASSLASVMAAADLAARDIYDLDGPSIPAGAMVTVDKYGTASVGGHPVGTLTSTDNGEGWVTVTLNGKLLPIAPIDHGYIRPPLTPAPHTGRPSVEWSKPADNARPHTTVRDGLDALLRFVLGNPNGERWMGKEAWAMAKDAGVTYRMDGGSVLPVAAERIARYLLVALDAIPGPSTQRWLTIPEARTYEQLRVELRRAMEVSHG